MNTLKSPLFLSATLALITILIFTSGISGVFLFDDIRNILKNESLNQPLFSTVQLNSLRPITNFSFALNKALFGPSPTSFHWVNILVHATSAVAFFFLVRRTTINSFESIENATTCAYFSALIWAVHPLHTQSVTYIVQRAESMMGMAMFSFLCVLHQAKESVLARRWLALAFAVYCFGIGCKEVMVTALPVGLLYDRVLLSKSWLDVLKQRGWFWGLCCLPIIVGVIKIVPVLMSDTSNVGFSISGVSPIEYMRTQPEVILQYLSSLVLPNRLSLDYGWPVENRIAVVAITTTIVVGGFALFCKSMLRGNRLSFWIVAAGIVLLPTSSFVPLKDLAFDQRMYVPSAFIIVFLVIAAQRIFIDRYWNKHFLTAALVAFALSMGASTISRNRLYASAGNMWEDVIAKCPNNWRGYFNSAVAHEKLDKELSLQRYQQAIELNPTYAPIWMNLGLFYWHGKSDLEEAQRRMTKAWELDSSNAVIAANLGAILFEKRLNNAESFLLKSLELDPNQPVALNNMAFLKLEQGKLADALSYAEKAVKVDPESDEARVNLGRALLAHSQLEEAERCFRRAIALNPQCSVAHYNLGTLLASKDPALARKHLERSLAINPKFSQAHNNLAAFLEEREPNIALHHYREAVRHDPKNRRAQENLQLLLQQIGME